MKDIKYVAGYHEWHLLINDVLVNVDGEDTFIDAVGDYVLLNGQVLASEAENVIETMVDYIRTQLVDYIEDGSVDFFKTEEEKQKACDIINSLTEEDYDNIYKAMWEAYKYYYRIVDRRFKFEGHTFEAVGNILGNFKTRTNAITNEETPITREKFSRNEFYKVAKKHHLSCDVYKIDYDNNYYMLGNDHFFKCNITETFKACDQYEKRYLN